MTNASPPEATLKEETAPKLTCQQSPGTFRPVVDRNRCEAKGPCTAVCPVGVLEIRTVSADDKAGLSLLGRIKLFVHGGKQAYAVRGEACEACGLCLKACPEHALTLKKLAEPLL